MYFYVQHNYIMNVGCVCVCHVCASIIIIITEQPQDYCFVIPKNSPTQHF